LSHKQIRHLVDSHLDEMIALVPDLLPTTLRQKFDLPELADAVRWVHRPLTLAQAEAGRRRLAIDELLDLQLMLARARHVARQGKRGTTFEVQKTLTSRLRETLPWELTNDQKQAIREIFEDM